MKAKLCWSTRSEQMLADSTIGVWNQTPTLFLGGTLFALAADNNQYDISRSPHRVTANTTCAKASGQRTTDAAAPHMDWYSFSLNALLQARLVPNINFFNAALISLQESYEFKANFEKDREPRDLSQFCTTEGLMINGTYSEASADIQGFIFLGKTTIENITAGTNKSFKYMIQANHVGGQWNIQSSVPNGLSVGPFLNGKFEIGFGHNTGMMLDYNLGDIGRLFRSLDTAIYVASPSINHSVMLLISAGLRNFGGLSNLVKQFDNVDKKGGTKNRKKAKE